MKVNKRKLFLSTICAISMMGLVGCGDDDDSNGGRARDIQEQTADGTFSATLIPLNTNVAPSTGGSVNITNLEDDVTVQVNVNGAPNSAHGQHMHIGTSCPTAASDTNGDGFIDAQEASVATGKVLIPFDSNLDTQSAGSGNHPSGSNYTYNETTSLATMLTDLLLPDPDTTDSVVKITSVDDLTFEGKVVEIHGVPADTVLPATVASMDGAPAHQTLPIACGVLVRTSTTGGTATGGTATGGTATGGTATGGTATGGTATGGTATGGTATGGTATGGTGGTGGIVGH